MYRIYPLRHVFLCNWVPVNHFIVGNFSLIFSVRTFRCRQTGCGLLRIVKSKNCSCLLSFMFSYITLFFHKWSLEVIEALLFSIWSHTGNPFSQAKTRDLPSESHSVQNLSESSLPRSSPAGSANQNCCSKIIWRISTNQNGCGKILSRVSTNQNCRGEILSRISSDIWALLYWSIFTSRVSGQD